MSPRAAWRLDAIGFPRVHDYVAGKSDWLAADLPYEGEALLAGRTVRRDIPTARVDDPASLVRERLARYGFGPLVAVNDAGVVMGTVRRDDVREAGDAVRVAEVLRFGISTVRPSEELEPLLHRMGHADLTRIVVTRSDGTLVGLLVASDARPEPLEG